MKTNMTTLTVIVIYGSILYTSPTLRGEEKGYSFLLGEVVPCVSVKRIEKKLSVSVPAGEQEQVGHVINFLCSLLKELCKVMFDWSI